MCRDMASIKKFAADTKQLSQSEKRVLRKLIQAAELLDTLYLAQKNLKYPGANLYPQDATKEEIERAAKGNSALLDPYTFVERKSSGDLVAVSYSKKFRKELTKIAKLIREAAAVSENETFRAYLEARADDLLEDNFDKSNALWLKTKDSRIGCVLGPFDRYHDRLFFQKRLYTAYIGILDEAETKEVGRLSAAILASERKHLPGTQRAKVSQVSVRIEHTVILAGLAGDILFVSDNLPSSADLYLLKKRGVISTIFMPMLEWRFSNWIFPISEALFSESKNPGIYPSQDELRKAFLHITVFDEVVHSIIRYDDAAPRLQEFFPYFDDVYTDILSVKAAAVLFLKGALTEKELEAIIVAEICQGLYYLNVVKTRPYLIGMAVGYTIFIDALLKGKALKKNGKRFELNFQRALIAIDELADTFEYYLSLANRDDAEDFLKGFDQDKILKEFKPHLSHLKTVLQNEEG